METERIIFASGVFDRKRQIEQATEESVTESLDTRIGHCIERIEDLKVQDQKDIETEADLEVLREVQKTVVYGNKNIRRGISYLTASAYEAIEKGLESNSESEEGAYTQALGRSWLNIWLRSGRPSSVRKEVERLFPKEE